MALSEENLALIAVERLSTIDEQATRSYSNAQLNRLLDAARAQGAAQAEKALAVTGDTLMKLDATNNALGDRALNAEARVKALEEAAWTAEAWLERWAAHVGDCRGGDCCSCGLTAVRAELEIALAALLDSPNRTKA